MDGSVLAFVVIALVGAGIVAAATRWIEAVRGRTTGHAAELLPERRFVASEDVLAAIAGIALGIFASPSILLAAIAPAAAFAIVFSIVDVAGVAGTRARLEREHSFTAAVPKAVWIAQVARRFGYALFFCSAGGAIGVAIG